MRALVLAAALVCSGGALDAQELRVVYNESYAPLSFQQNDTVAGILVDVAAEVAKRAKVTIQQTGYPWSRAQEIVKAGQADAFLTAVTPERQGYAVFAPEPLLVVNLMAATSRTNPRLAELEKLKTLDEALRYKHVNYLGTSLAATLLAKASVQYIGATDSIFDFLLANRADLYIETELNLRYNAQRRGVENQIEVLPVVFQTGTVHLGVAKTSPWAARIDFLNGIIKAMRADGTLKRILSHYVKMGAGF